MIPSKERVIEVLKDVVYFPKGSNIIDCDMVKELDDTLLFITADHGHINTESVVLQDYPVIMDCLERLPSLEPRVLNFFVKEDKKDIFVKEFQKELRHNNGKSNMLLSYESIRNRMYTDDARYDRGFGT